MQQQYRSQKKQQHKENVSLARSYSASGRWNNRISADDESSQNISSPDDQSLSDSDPETMLAHQDNASVRKVRSAKLKMKLLFSKKPLENVDYFVHFLKSRTNSALQLDVQNYTWLSHLTDHQIRYTGNKISAIIKKNVELENELIKYWIEHLLCNRVVKSIFLENEWDIPDSFLTTELLVEKVAASLENKHLRRDQTSL